MKRRKLTAIRLTALSLLVSGITAAGFLSGASCVNAADTLKEQIGADGYIVTRRTAGDLTQDAKITVRDALRAFMISTKLQPEDIRADVNYDNVIDDEDVRLLLKAALIGDCTNMGYDRPDDSHFLIVDPDSCPLEDYCFHTLGDAVAYLNAKPPRTENQRKIVLIAPGVVREQVELTAPYVTFRAMDLTKETKISTYYADAYSYRSRQKPLKGAVFVNKAAHDFHGEYITFENSHNIYIPEEEKSDLLNETSLENRTKNITSNQIQAQALYSKADRQIFDHCRFYGRQDTLYIDNGRMYFKDCYIEGTVDFIYGNAAAVFEGCQINSPYGGGYLTAASTFAINTYGFLFHNCTLTKDATASGVAAPSDNSYALGRPWGGGYNANTGTADDVAMVAYVNCKMDSHIKTGSDRFADMSIKREDARYFEYGSMDLFGNALDLSAVTPSYVTVFTEADITGDGQYAPWKWLYGDDQWNPGGYQIP